MAKKPIPTLEQYQAAWIGALAPHVPEPVSTVALVNPPGAVAASAAAVGGRSLGGLLGGVLGKRAAERSTGGAGDVPAIVAVALTSTALYLFEVDISPDGDQLTVLRLWDTWSRRGLQLDVARKVMSERLTFDLADGRQIDLDGMFVGRQKERLYQPLIDQLKG